VSTPSPSRERFSYTDQRIGSAASEKIRCLCIHQGCVHLLTLPRRHVRLQRSRLRPAERHPPSEIAQLGVPELTTMRSTDTACAFAQVEKLL
jgi:hypothetical protein